MATESKQDAPPPPPAGETDLSPAELAKKKGNDAFLAKNYADAIKFYSEAIELQPEVAIYYSNRSACHGYLNNWQQAYEDALACVTKDPKFIKGYYRLASAQTELKQFDDAETTLRAALSLEPGNDVIARQLRNLKAKKSAASGNQVARQPKKLDDAQIKEVMELQDQLNSYRRELRTAAMQLNTTERESRINQVTSEQIKALESSVNLYRSVGKAFVLTERAQVESRLEKEREEMAKQQRVLSDRQEYLERRITSHMTNIQELTTGP